MPLLDEASLLKELVSIEQQWLSAVAKSDAAAVIEARARLRAVEAQLPGALRRRSVSPEVLQYAQTMITRIIVAAGDVATALHEGDNIIGRLQRSISVGSTLPTSSIRSDFFKQPSISTTPSSLAHSPPRLDSRGAEICLTWFRGCLHDPTPRDADLSALAKSCKVDVEAMERWFAATRSQSGWNTARKVARRPMPDLVTLFRAFPDTLSPLERAAMKRVQSWLDAQQPSRPSLASKSESRRLAAASRGWDSAVRPMERLRVDPDDDNGINSGPCYQRVYGLLSPPDEDAPSPERRPSRSPSPASTCTQSSRSSSISSPPSASYPSPPEEPPFFAGRRRSLSPVGGRRLPSPPPEPRSAPLPTMAGRRAPSPTPMNRRNSVAGDRGVSSLPSPQEAPPVYTPLSPVSPNQLSARRHSVIDDRSFGSLPSPADRVFVPLPSTKSKRPPPLRNATAGPPSRRLSPVKTAFDSFEPRGPVRPMPSRASSYSIAIGDTHRGSARRVF